MGKPNDKLNDSTLLALEKTTTLVTIGVYKFIRHPLYSSLFFLTWGAYFKSLTVWSIGLTLVATGFLWATAKVEENENLNYFGDDYREYISLTKMFVPFLF